MADDSDRIWEAFRRETASVAQHLGIGATALGIADFERTASYAQAFFALTIGLERAAKLVLTIDAAIQRDGQFLSSQELRQYGHKLDALLGAVAMVAERRGIGVRLPDSTIHQAILQTLTAFASNLSRYYNLEALTAADNRSRDPIAAWYEDVTTPVLAAHYNPQRRETDEREAQAVKTKMEVLVSVIATAETGESIRDLGELRRRGAEARFARPWERMYVLGVARALTAILGQMGEHARGAGLAVPYLEEYFYDFQADDADFRRRKVWTIER